MDRAHEGFVEVQTSAAADGPERDELGAFLHGIGVAESAEVASVLRADQILEPAWLLRLDSDDLLELLSSCKSRGVTVGDRAKLKNAIRQAGNDAVLGNDAVPMTPVSAAARKRPHGRSDGQKSPPPQSPQPGPAPRWGSAGPQNAHSDANPPQMGSSNTAQSDSHPFGPQGANLLASFLLLLNPIRHGAADFIDGLAARYLYPNLDDANALSGWRNTTLPRLLVVYAIVRGVASMFTRVDAMMAFLVGEMRHSTPAHSMLMAKVDAMPCRFFYAQDGAAGERQ
jgi:hypothetical protein